MLKIYDCIATAHDLRLVLLAGVVCALSSYAAVGLLRHARNSIGATRSIWLAVSATTIGFGTWATHFIGMLAFSPNVPTGYNVTLTVLSLVAVIVLTGVGLAIAAHAKSRVGMAVGGVVIGGGVAAMHYTGMAAYEIAGTVVWDVALVAVSIALGAMLGAAALPVGLKNSTETWKINGALLLTAAICSHHFTAMAAVTILPDPRIVVSETAIPSTWIAIGVGIASFTIILLALAGLALDLRERRRSDLEGDRMKGLANAAVEGLLICDGNDIVTVNDSFGQLIACETSHLVGASVEECFVDPAIWDLLKAHPNKALESTLRRQDGKQVPVELILRPIDFGGRVHHVVAVRDLQARKRNEEHIRFLALHDGLTELPNRTFLNTRMDEEISLAQSRGEKFAVLCLDLDRFKEINDLFGHLAGDNVLKTVANRVKAVLTERQIMARLGGDEFAILMPSLSSPSEAGRLADTVIAALRVNGGTPETNTISSSVGIALYPDDGTDKQTLLTHADTALYRAKSDERGSYRFFEAKMGAEVRDRRFLEHDLRHALARNELRLVYQPQKNLQTGQITGFEALLRWEHPTRGDVSPAIFIPIAEESDVILAIGQWVLNEACREAAGWSKPLTIAVNVSAVQLYQARFVQTLHQTLIETGLSPHLLELEITETALIRDFTRALHTLRGVKALGVRIAMDDFGTGYSSLSNLRAFPFDRIKIDRSFVKSVHTNDQAAAIVRAVLGLGRGLNLTVLAEGVETADELNFLRNELCDDVQGFFIGRPGAIETFSDRPLESCDLEVTLRNAS